MVKVALLALGAVWGLASCAVVDLPGGGERGISESIPGTNFSVSFKPSQGTGCPWGQLAVVPTSNGGGDATPLWASVCDAPPVSAGLATLVQPPVSLEGGYTLEEQLVWRTDAANVSSVGPGPPGSGAVVVVGTLVGGGALPSSPLPFSLYFTSGGSPAQVNITAVVGSSSSGAGAGQDSPAPNRVFLTCVERTNCAVLGFRDNHPWCTPAQCVCGAHPSTHGTNTVPLRPIMC